VKTEINAFKPAERKEIFRVMSFVGLFALPLFRLTLPADSWDPWIFRLGLSGICGVIFVSSYIPAVTEKLFNSIVYLCLSLIILWFEVLVFYNDYSYEYTSTWFIVFFSLALIIQKTNYLRYYTIVGLGLPSVLWFFSDNPQFQIHLLLPLSVYGIVVLNITMGLRIQGEEKLESSGEQFRMITEAAFEGSKDGILVVDLQGRSLQFNQVFEKMWAIPSEIINSSEPNPGVGQVMELLVDPSAWSKTIDAIRIDPSIQTSDLQNLKDGRVIDRFSRPLTKEGKPIGRLWFFRDITQEKRAEAQIVKNLTILRAVFDLSGVGILVLDEDRKVINYNDLYLQIWNMDDKFLIGSLPEEVIAYSQSQLRNSTQAEVSMRQVLSQPGFDTPELLYFKNGRTVERMTRHLDLDGKQQGWVFFYRDITQLLKTTQALQDSEARNSAIIKAIPDQLFRLSERGVVEDYVNKGMNDTEGLKERVRGMHIRDLFPRDFSSKVLDHISQVIKTTEPAYFEDSLFEGGVRKEYEARIALSGNAEVLLILRDITAKKEAENQLSQRNFELDSFIYRASHDLKAPLNSLMGLLSIVRSENIDSVIAKYLTMMDTSILKLDTFIRNLALFSKNENQSLVLESVVLDPLVKEVFEKLDFLDQEHRVSKEWKVTGTPHFTTDAFRLELILENLISNSLKYYDQTKKNSFLMLTIYSDSEGLTLRMEDNGIGIPAEHQSRLYDMFFRATNQAFGSGMGLYLVKNAVDKLGGRISIQSSPGENTVCEIFLPVTQ
jgi:PAS domain S-box-containing protein